MAITLNRHARTRKQPESLSARAYTSIREKILRGEFSLGAPLSRRRLAGELGMSLVPVAEALRRLEQEGLVESRPRAGTRVRLPSAADIRERFILREALESQAAREFAHRADPAAREELQQMGTHLDQLYTCCATENVDAGFLYSAHLFHMNFHLRIAEGAACTLLRAAIEREQVLVFNWLFDTAAKRRSLPTGFHSALAAALCSGDPVAADAAMRAHVRYGIRSVTEAILPAAPSEWREGRG